MYKSHLKYLGFLPLLIFLIGCNRKSDSGLSQGRIEYDITYLQGSFGNFSTGMLPHKMNMVYKNNNTRNSIEGGMGFFNLVNISDLKNFRNITFLKFIDKKYIYTGGKKEPPCCFGRLEGMQLEFTEETREIAGFICKRVIASFPDDGIESFDIWYTEDIPLNHPNGNSPFRDIPGVMLEFNTLLGEVAMHVQARKFEAVAVHDREFQSPVNYKPVTKAEIEKIIHALLD